MSIKLFWILKKKTNRLQSQESVAHVLSGCSALVQTQYLARHNAVLYTFDMFAFGRFYYAELREMISYIRDYVSTAVNLIWIAYKYVVN